MSSVNNVIGEKTLLEKRIEGFWNRLKEICKSRASFRKQIEVDLRHIAFRAYETNDPVRNAIDNEKIASVIIHGWLNKQKCRFQDPIEIVVEGKFEGLMVVDIQKQKEFELDKICVRVVVRERKPKHLIVTVYPDRGGEIDMNSTPKVPNEIW